MIVGFKIIYVLTRYLMITNNKSYQINEVTFFYIDITSPYFSPNCICSLLKWLFISPSTFVIFFTLSISSTFSISSLDSSLLLKLRIAVKKQ